MPHSVFILQVITKYDIEDTPRLTREVLSFVKRWCKPGMHAKRNIAYVIVTDETLHDLASRLWNDLIRLQELGSVERFFIQPAPDEVISDHGSVDALMHWMRAGRVEAWERNKAQDVRHRKRWHRRV
ncbi:hypothetical protein [Mesorhizobium sp. Root102]|uniref:hypothetical protein n=1 Tax=Mesorhizobium sp. Root102 TaxID=1736422 RepID=UPI000B28A6F1|nr:hypothetical protein [Mesorhizobium sp. Root102]